jgi:lipoprotein-releasing system permease protein
MSLALYIARRLYAGKQRNVSKPAIRIAMLGIAIGIAVMTVSICVVLGFKNTIRDKVVGFGGHITITNYLTYQTPDDSQPVVTSDSLTKRIYSIKGVKHVERFAMKQGVLKTDKEFLGVMFKGVAEDFDTTFIAHSLVAGKMPALSSEKSTQQLLISKIMADKLMLKPGDKVYAYYLSDADVRARPFTISGIYQTNLTKYDETICFADLYTIARLNGWQKGEATGYEVRVNDFDSLNVVEDRVIDKINKTEDDKGHTLTSFTIMESSPQIFSWLGLLDLNVWIIIVLMVCISGFTMISGLLIIILERIATIGVLKALGARNSLIRRTFIWLALFIVIKGMVLGNIIGLGLCLLQKHTGFATLDPTSYYVSEVPVEINIPLIVLLNIGTLLVTIAALVVPSFLVSAVEPAKTIKTE